MALDGEPPEETGEQRIRLAPRLVRAVPSTLEPTPLPAPPVEEWIEAEAPSTLVAKPDRSRMDLVSLDRSSSRKQARAARQKNRSVLRGKRSRQIDIWLVRGCWYLLTLAVGGGALWVLKQRLGKSATHLFTPPAQVAPTVAPSDRVLDMLEAFLTTPGASAKARYVLEAGRVESLMAVAYAAGTLPEGQLRFGVPQPLEIGIWAVPAKVLGPPEFLLHLMVREVEGQPLLDWETYEQEMTQRFVAFASTPQSGEAEFRLVLERAHAFAAALDEAVAVRVAAPGSAALADPVVVRADLCPMLGSALPWGQRRRALVGLAWQTPPGGTARLMLTSVIRWEFLP